MKDRRSNYRVQHGDSALRVSVEVDGKRREGVVVDTSAGGVAVCYPQSTAPVLTLGDGLEIVFHGGGIAVGRSVHVWVKSSSDTGVHRRYGFSFSDPALVKAGVPFERRESFNRRAWVRVVPDRPFTASVVALDGSGGPQTLDAEVGDVSAGGLALVINDGSQLRDVTMIRCLMTFPGEENPRTLTGRICNRDVADGVLRLGVAFEVDDDGESAPVYERSWDCLNCKSHGLLATSHVRCPACRHARGDGDTYLLSWSRIRPQSAHLYWGDEHTCTACEATSAAAAAFCGRCGPSLA